MNAEGSITLKKKVHKPKVGRASHHIQWRKKVAALMYSPWPVWSPCRCADAGQILYMLQFHKVIMKYIKSQFEPWECSGCKLLVSSCLCEVKRIRSLIWLRVHIRLESPWQVGPWKQLLDGIWMQSGWGLSYPIVTRAWERTTTSWNLVTIRLVLFKFPIVTCSCEREREREISSIQITSEFD